MKKFSLREKVIGAVCAAICLAFVVKQILVAGVAEYGSSLEDRIKVTAARIKQARQEAAREPMCDRKLEALSAVFGKVSSEGVETSSITSRIDVLAKDSDVRIVNVQPQKPRQEKYYSEFPVEIILDGEWKNALRLLFKLTSSSERLEVRALRLEKDFGGLSALRGRMIVIRTRL